MNTSTIAPELHMAERALDEADMAIEDCWELWQSGSDSQSQELKALSALARGFTVMLALLERQECRD